MTLPSSFRRTPATDAAALGMARISLASDTRGALRPRDEAAADRKAGIEPLEPHWIAAIESATD